MNEPNSSLSLLEQRIAPLRRQIALHPLYTSIRSMEHLRLFMQAHVFAVWDFMSLLKSLQRALTCVSVPWVVTKHPASRRFINEIVLGEESDEYKGRSVSHFEIYLEAMEQAGADSSAIRAVATASEHCSPEDIDQILEGAPPEALEFVRTTFRVIRRGSLAEQAAAFTFGREDAIPEMFRVLVNDLSRNMEGDLDQFIWYLQRHIEVDADEHGPLSLQMVADLCGTDTALWEEATLAAEEGLRARLTLWDGILSQIRSTAPVASQSLSHP